MPWKPHPRCTEPESCKALWRYMDLWKLQDILFQRALYFPRLACLDDPWEGYLTSATVNVLREVQHRAHNDALVIANVERLLTLYTNARQRLHVNCWHIGDQESAAMWKIYTKAPSAVCLQSTIDRLRQALAADEQHEVSAGKVTYADYEVHAFPWDQLFTVALTKRLPYSYECEFRAVHINASSERTGVLVAVHTEVLIERVVLSPAAPDGAQDAVGDLLHRYGVQVDVVRSSMNAPLPY